MSRDEQPFLEEIAASPYDDGPRLIYADWLEDRGDERGEYLRLEVELNGLTQDDALFKELSPRLRELRKSVPVGWLAAVGRTQVANCLAVLLECPKRWSRLVELSDPAKRFCATCNQFVYYCKTVEQARDRAARGQCVAMDATVHKGGDAWRFSKDTHYRDPDAGMTMGVMVPTGKRRDDG